MLKSPPIIIIYTRMGVFMEIRKKNGAESEEIGKTRGKFPRFKGMVDRLKRKAMVLAVVSVAAFGAMHCGPDPSENPDGGHDADATTDAGTDSDTTTDSGGDAGQSLCDMYPDGHENRHTFYLGISEPVEDGDQVLMFRELKELSSGMSATFAHFNKNAPANVEFLGFYVGDQEVVDVPGIGETTMELCSTTALECKWQITGNEGDVNCTAVLASTRTWGSN